MTCCGGNCHTKERLQRKASNLIRYASEEKLREVVNMLETVLPEPTHAPIALAAAPLQDGETIHAVI